jgi:hypothetical protein
MRLKLAAALATLLAPISAMAGQAARPFTVGALVIHSARVHAEVVAPGTSLLRTAGARVALVSVDGAPPRLVAGPESPLPAGAREVTVHY